MSIIEAVRKYLQTCPLLKGGTLNVDFLPPEAATYSVDVVPNRFMRAILHSFFKACCRYWREI